MCHMQCHPRRQSAPLLVHACILLRLPQNGASFRAHASGKERVSPVLQFSHLLQATPTSNLEKYATTVNNDFNGNRILRKPQHHVPWPVLGFRGVSGPLLRIFVGFRVPGTFRGVSGPFSGPWDPKPHENPQKDFPSRTA